MPVILSAWQNNLTTDENGLATLQPNTGRVAGNTEILGSAAAGGSSASYLLQSFDIVSGAPEIHQK
jgi:hypothetical protein